MVDGRERAVVRFGIIGSTSVTQDWTFERDPSVDTSHDDEDHEVADGGWLVAHRGWRLMGIAVAGVARGVGVQGAAQEQASAR